MPKDKTTSIFAKRRTRFIKELGAGNFALVHNAPVIKKGRDMELKYRPDSNFYYLTGMAEEHSAAFFDTTKPNFQLFLRKRDPKLELWNGSMLGLAGAKRQFQADQAQAIDELPNHLQQRLARGGYLYYGHGQYNGFDQQVMKTYSAYLPDLRAGQKPSDGLRSPMKILDQMRWRKDELELRFMQTAADITTHSFNSLLRKLKPGMMEYQVEAEIEHGFRYHGASGPSFNTIAAGGANATVLHYNGNSEKLRKDQLVLIDAGCEFGWYASDVTRTFPVGGRFSKAQRAIYQVVLDAQQATIDAIKPGITFQSLEGLAKRKLAQGLIKVGIIKGTASQAIANGSLRTYFPHRIGHWLGLDVHDVGRYTDDSGRSVKLEPGCVLTVEPGIYIAKNDKNVAPEFRGIGVRIEDDVVVTKSSHRILTEDIPKEVDEIEAIMNAPTNLRSLTC